MKDTRIIIYVLIAVLMLAIVWRGEFSGQGTREWQRCKESVFQQVVFGDCTLIYQGEQRPT